MNKTPTDSPAALQALLDAAPSRRSRIGWRLAGIALLLPAVAWLLKPGGSETVGRYLTDQVTRADLVVTISASGTLEPTTSVDVGSEMSGTMAEVLVQENDRVKKGQLLARLDLSKLNDAVIRSRAALMAAEASVAQADATLAEAKAALSRMRHVAQISGGKVPAKTELETAEATLQRAIANQGSAKAAVVQAQAAVKTDETNLAKGAIRSPVDGVVLSRKIEPGQTVVAAMTTPVLFTLAEDLTRMELQVKVDEADVGNVSIGQAASFTVAAWPGRQFPARIRRVGLGSTITDNVVTYKTVLEVQNDELALRPGMTATASIVTTQRDRVLLAPNAALRFTPPEKAAPSSSGDLVSRLLPRPPPEPKRPVAPQSTATPQVWVLEDGRPRSVPVRTGASNGRMTEIVEDDLRPGMAVITDYQEPSP